MVGGSFLANILGVVLAVVVILVSVILHELAHGFIAYKLGDNTAKDAGRLTLNPIKHIDPIFSVFVPMFLFLIKAPVFGGAKPVPVNSGNLKGKEWGMALVALAGPVTNILIALAAFLISFFLGSNGIVLEISSYFLSINLSLAVFNLIPIPPLDGSRILYAIAPDGIRPIIREIEKYGLIIVYVLVALFGVQLSEMMFGIEKGIYQVFLWIVGL